MLREIRMFEWNSFFVMGKVKIYINAMPTSKMAKRTNKNQLEKIWEIRRLLLLACLTEFRKCTFLQKQQKKR